MYIVLTFIRKTYHDNNQHWSNEGPNSTSAYISNRNPATVHKHKPITPIVMAPPKHGHNEINLSTKDTFNNSN